MAFLKQRGKYWYIYYYDPFTRNTNGFSTKLKNKTEARKELKRFEARRTLKIQPENVIPASAESVTLAEALETFLLSRELSPKSRTAYRTAFSKLTAAIGDKRVRSIKEFDNVRFHTHLNSLPLSRNSKANYTRHIYSLFQWLLKNKLIDANPFTKIKPETKEPRPFDTKEMRRFFDFLKKRNKDQYDAVKLLYLCAYRINEFINAEWSDFDFENETVYIRNTKGNATMIPMLKDTKEHLLQSSFPRKGRISRWKSADSMRTFWNSAVKKLNLNYSFHSLRKARGTDLANAGANQYFLMKFMRHADLSVTMQYYVKIDMLKAKKQLDAVLGDDL